MSKQKKKTLLIILIQMLIVAGFVIGADWSNRSSYILFQSYYADMFIPFGYYFLLSIKGDKSKYFDTWWKKSLAVFLLCATSETLQYFGVYAFARVFDPLDYFVYATGILVAAFVDRRILRKNLSFWS